MASLNDLDTSAADELEKNRPELSLDDLDLSALDEIEAAEAERFDGTLASLGSGFGQGVTFGFQDELSAAAQPVINRILDIATRQNVSDIDRSNYSERRDDFRKDVDEARNQSPSAFGLGEVFGGAVSSAVPTAGISRLASGTGKLASLAKGMAQGNLAPTVLRGATESALYGAGVSEGEKASDVALDALGSAAIGGAFTAGISGLSKIGGAIFGKNEAGKSVGNINALKKFGKIFANVDEDVTEAYLRDPKKYQKFLSIGELKDKLDDALINKQAGVEGAEQVFERAEKAFKEGISNLKDDLAVAKADLRQVVSNEKFQAKNLEAPTITVDEIESTLKSLKNKVIKGSDDAFEILEKEWRKSGKKIPRKQIEDQYEAALKRLSIEGAPPITGGGVKTYKSLSSELERVRKLPEQIQPGSLKEIIQSLDDDIWGIESASEFLGPELAFKRQIRFGLDKGLKELSPAYKNAMEGLAEDSALLSQLNKKFGTREKITSQIYRSTSPKEQGNFRNLNKALEKTGQRIGPEFSEFQQASNRFKNPKSERAFMSQLPENQRVIEIENRIKQLQKSGASSLEVLKQVSDVAKEELKSLGMSTRNTENIVKAFERGNPSIEQIRAVEKLAPDLLDELRAARVGGAFNRQDTQGSRRTLLGTILGKAIGLAVGGTAGSAIGGEYGAGAGAIAGFSADRYAGRIFKSLLDTYAKTPSMANIANKLPQNPELFKKYGNSLMNAARQGGNALSVRSYVLGKTDPEFRELMNEDDEGF